MKEYLLRLFKPSKEVIVKAPKAIDPLISARLMMLSMDRFNYGGYVLNHSTHSYR